MRYMYVAISFHFIPFRCRFDMRSNATQWLCTLKTFKSTTTTTTIATATKIMGCLWTVTKTRKRETNWCRFHSLHTYTKHNLMKWRSISLVDLIIFSAAITAASNDVHTVAYTLHTQTHMTTWWSDRRQKRMRWAAKMAIICWNWAKYVMNSNFLFHSLFCEKKSQITHHEHWEFKIRCTSSQPVSHSVNQWPQHYYVHIVLSCSFAPVCLYSMYFTYSTTLTYTCFVPVCVHCTCALTRSIWFSFHIAFYHILCHLFSNSYNFDCVFACKIRVRNVS